MTELEQNIMFTLSTLRTQYETKIRYILAKYRYFPVVRGQLVQLANIQYNKTVEVLKKIYEDTKNNNSQAILIDRAIHNPIIENKAIRINVNNNIKKALLIGINYRNTSYELYGCINDAYSMEKLLKTKYGYSSTTVITDDTQIKPTSSNIINLFTNFLRNSKMGETLFVMFSGHGSYIRDRNNDEQTKNDQMIIGCNLVGVLDDTIKTIINKYLPAGVNLIFMADSCFSGSVLDLRYQYMDTLNNKLVNVNNKQTETRGNVILISGCQDNQTSADTVINNIPNGALSIAVMDALNGINKPTWSNFITTVRRTLRGNGFKQVAQLSSGKPLNINNQICI
jgi:hypothetical protein